MYVTYLYIWFFNDISYLMLRVMEDILCLLVRKTSSISYFLIFNKSRLDRNKYILTWYGDSSLTSKDQFYMLYLIVRWIIIFWSKHDPNAIISESVSTKFKIVVTKNKQYYFSKILNILTRASYVSYIWIKSSSAKTQKKY